MGTLEGYDQNTNLVLTKSKEIILSPSKPGSVVGTSAIILRGDDLVFVGEVDEEIEQMTDYSQIFAEKIKNTKNT